MSASHRICETCVYCSFAGNCDRYNKPLTSIEQPACDAYEIHPLLAENAKLRELIADLWEYIHIGTVHDGQSLHDRTRELGVEV